MTETSLSAAPAELVARAKAPGLIACRVALRALARNRMRASLTAIGITIGTAAVISTVAIGEGAAAQLRAQLLALGDNMIWVEAGGRNIGGVRTGAGGSPKLVVADMRAILQSAPRSRAARLKWIPGSR